MTQASPNVSLNGSRLIRFLSDLAVSDVEVSHKQFTEKLGQLISFSDAITLSAVHSKLSKMACEPTEATSESVRVEFLRVREVLVKSIIMSFTFSTRPSTIPLPIPKADTPRDKAVSYEPYQRFYARHQREIDFKVQSLQLYVRDGVSGLSLELAQLVALDAALGDVLAVHTRRLFAVIPKLLSKRFEYLKKEHQQALANLEDNDTSGSNDPFVDNQAEWIKPGGWLHTFYQEMQGLLLAELDVRLQPILGLVETLNEQLETDNEKLEALNEQVEEIDD